MCPALNPPARIPARGDGALHEIPFLKTVDDAAKAVPS
jgi:hypothetical protein